MTHSTERKPEIFDVHIVNPADMVQDSDTARENIIAKRREVKRDTFLKRKPVIVRRRRRPVDLDNSVKPDVLFGEGLGEVQRDAGDSERKDTGKPKRPEPGRTEKEAAPSAMHDNRPPDSDRPALSPDFLFDKKTIEKYASRRSPGGAGDQDGKGLMFYAPEFENRAYMRMLRDRIESIWKYPKEAARLGLSGDLYIKFSIRKNGELHDIQLVRTSGYRELDEAAIQALKKADPYWPLPENYDKEFLEITGHFIYVLGSSYVM